MTITREKLEQIFKVYDDKRNGSIKTDQIGKLIRSARLFPSEEDIIDLRNRADPKRIGTFNMNTFVDVALSFADKQSNIRHDQELLKAFSFFDEGNSQINSDQSGFISENELRKIMSSFAQPLTQEQIKDITKYAKAKDGRINYKEFIRTILTGKLD